ncbi:unnamed protein product [Paramecium sonneborni]|uniref:Uncharacterized protein n=1 Tax=Paramecium sonneborni TaxID=65129 RepID=A0A8S1R0D1_9CILI|nr:unnamed protein product [Paramecium sonneborni]
MIKISVQMEQLKTSQNIEVFPHQKGSNIIQQLFNKLDFDQEIRQIVQSNLFVENVQVDIDKTIEALDINNYSKVEVKLSKKIIIECDHEFLGTIRYETDAFASVNIFKNYLIREIIKINSCEIVIINQQNGNQLDRDSWGKFGIFKNVKIRLIITKIQKIVFNQTNYEMKIDLFQPIAKIIKQFKNTQQLNEECLIFKTNSGPINPDEFYKQLNIPDIPWVAEITEDFVYKLSFEQQGIKEITVRKDLEIFEVLRLIRTIFKIEKTIPIKLEYKLNGYNLDINNTVKQEYIPSYSQLNIIKEPSDNKINIQLLNRQTQNKQIKRMPINSTLADLDQLINHDKNTQIISYYIDESLKDRKFNLRQLDLQSESIIKYEIESKQESIIQNEKSQKIQEIELHEPSDDFTQIRINFENRQTNKSKQILISCKATVIDGLREVLKTEALKKTEYYIVQFNNQIIDINSRFDVLQIVQDSTLVYYTEYVIFQASVEKKVLEIVVDQNQSISLIEDQFRKQHKIDQSLTLQQINQQNKKETLKQFLIINQNFKFEFKKTIEPPVAVIKSIEFSILIKELNQNAQFHINQDDTCIGMCETIKRRFALAKNQVLKLFVGDRLINENESVLQIKNYINQSQKQLIVDWQYTLDLQLESNYGDKKIIQVQLEETLQHALQAQMIIGDKFTYKSQLLDANRKIKDLPVENNGLIKYQLNFIIVNFENNRTGLQQQLQVQQEETLEELAKRLEVKINAFYHKNQNLDFSTKIRSIQLAANEYIKYDEQEDLHEPSENFSNRIQIRSDQKYVIVLIGQRKLKYQIDQNIRIGSIKKTVYNQIIAGYGLDISKYVLKHQDKQLIDENLIASELDRSPIELQFELLVGESQ